MGTYLKLQTKAGQRQQTRPKCTYQYFPTHSGTQHTFSALVSMTLSFTDVWHEQNPEHVLQDWPELVKQRKEVWPRGMTLQDKL